MLGLCSDAQSVPIHKLDFFFLWRLSIISLAHTSTGQTAGGGEDTLTAEGRASTAEDQGGGGSKSLSSATGQLT